MAGWDPEYPSVRPGVQSGGVDLMPNEVMEDADSETEEIGRRD